MAKYLKFIKCDDGHHVVITKNGVALGTTNKCGKIFKRSPVFLDLSDECEFTSGCLRELADAIDSQYGAESLKSSHNKSMPKLPKSYSESEELFLKWWHTDSRSDTLSYKNMQMFYNIIVGNNGS